MYGICKERLTPLPVSITGAEPRFLARRARLGTCWLSVAKGPEPFPSVESQQCTYSFEWTERTDGWGDDDVSFHAEIETLLDNCNVGDALAIAFRVVFLHFIDVVFLVGPDLLVLWCACVGMISQDRCSGSLFGLALPSKGFGLGSSTHMDHIDLISCGLLSKGKTFDQNCRRSIMGCRGSIDHN